VAVAAEANRAAEIKPEPAPMRRNAGIDALSRLLKAVRGGGMPRPNFL
jgi:hypothetical protein